jgi:hypothetical protein
MATSKKKSPKKRGRPSDYSAKIAFEICSRIAERESLRKICAEPDMPDKTTVLRWLAEEENAEFRTQYAHAREMQADALFDETLEIADDGSNDWMERLDKDGEAAGWQLNGEHVQRSRLRVDTRKWAAGKLAPKKYGDRLQHTGEGGGPIRVRPDFSKLSDEELDVLERILGRTAQPG